MYPVYLDVYNDVHSVPWGVQWCTQCIDSPITPSIQDYHFAPYVPETFNKKWDENSKNIKQGSKKRR